MRILRLGYDRRPILGIERRVTGAVPNLIYHWHFIIMGWHICFLPKREKKPIDPIALFGDLCRK